MSKIRQILNISYCRYYCTKQLKKKVPIISCKRPEFNHYEGQTYSKFEGIPLASKGWLHPKSKNDYFIVHGNANKVQEGPEEPKSKKSFEETGICKELEAIIASQGITHPTYVQGRAIPSILQGYNTVVTAETGCGKTLAYLLPIMQHILEWKPHVAEEFNSPLAVVITPSRELATQIAEVAQNIGQSLNINVTELVGGNTKRKMLNPPIEYSDLLVTTLGAYSKLVTTGILKIQNVHHVVLDEADTLLDDSFMGKLSNLLKKFSLRHKVTIQSPPVGCQITFVSATLPHELPEAVSAFVDPQSLRNISTPNIHRLQPHVAHKFIRLGKAQKPLELLKLVQADVSQQRPVMIFSNQTSTCDFVSMFLNENNVECININGKMAVALKMGKFDQYKTGKTRHIINYDFPLYTAEYLHRSGRTGRLGAPAGCLVTSLVAWPREVRLVQRLETALRQNGTLPSVNANIRRQIEDRIVKLTGAAI